MILNVFKKILENFLKPLCDMGVLTSWLNPDNKREKFYKIESEPEENNLDYIVKKIIEQSKVDDSFIDSGIEQLKEYSKKNGEFVILDSKRNQIDIPNLKKHLLKIDNNSNTNSASQA